MLHVVFKQILRTHADRRAVEHDRAGLVAGRRLNRDELEDGGRARRIDRKRQIQGRVIRIRDRSGHRTGFDRYVGLGQNDGKKSGAAVEKGKAEHIAAIRIDAHSHTNLK
ncbi:hypothetical protein [Bradyrhizobium ivorense]|uniref:hypothetical protein n=1 Tax=Bradyrhizobium ivorense TaxID=2511166 RepID=UPI001123EB45|nr:hypothetical protein [Bradyrhizobium ivorense]